MLNTRYELVQLRKKLDKLYANEAPKHIVNEVRNTELSRIIHEQDTHLTTAISNLTASRQAIIDEGTYRPKDDSEALARRLRLESEFSSMPRGALLKHESEDPETLTMQAATLRKRGMHDEADEVYQKIGQAKQAVYLNPMVKGIEREVARHELLRPSADPTKLWIGEDVKNIKPDDFAEVDNGKVKFKYDGQTIEV